MWSRVFRVFIARAFVFVYHCYYYGRRTTEIPLYLSTAAQRAVLAIVLSFYFVHVSYKI